MAEMTQAAPYPVQIEVDYPERLSRLLIFVKWLLAVPHYIVIALYAIAVWFTSVAGFFIILATGNLPEGIVDFHVGYQRYVLRVYSYVFLLCDKYPPFGGTEDSEYPARLQFQPADSLSRGLVLIKWLLVIPHIIILLFYGIAAGLVVLVAWFAILFTARFPQALFDFVVGYLRWQLRVYMYAGGWAAYNPYHGGLLTDRYPPFSPEP